jgi:hypothetical protein
VLANIGQRGAEAQQRLWDAQGAAEGNIDAQRAQLAEQLGQQLQQYDASRAADVLKRSRELDDQEYERAQADQARRDQTGMQLANMLRQAERDQVSDEQFEKQFGLSKQQFEAQLANQQWQRDYQAARDAVSDAQWQQNYDFNAQKWADTLAEQLYQRQYQESRDAVKDSQWAKEYGLKAAASTGTGAATGSGGGSLANSKRSSGGSVAAGGDGYAGSTFDSKEYAKSLAGIKSGVLKSNESPLTTFGSVSAANAYYKSNGQNAGQVAPVSTQNANQNAKNPTTTAGLIQALTPSVSSVATSSTTNKKNVVPETRVLQGPVSTDILNKLNAKSASTGIRFESELANALKNKKK